MYLNIISIKIGTYYKSNNFELIQHLSHKYII